MTLFFFLTYSERITFPRSLFEQSGGFFFGQGRRNGSFGVESRLEGLNDFFSCFFLFFFSFRPFFFIFGAAFSISYLAIRYRRVLPANFSKGDRHFRPLLRNFGIHIKKNVSIRSRCLRRLCQIDLGESERCGILYSTSILLVYNVLPQPGLLFASSGNLRIELLSSPRRVHPLHLRVLCLGTKFCKSLHLSKYTNYLNLCAKTVFFFS